MEPAKTAFSVNQESFESYVSAEIDTKIRNWPDIRHDTIWDDTSTGISFPPAALGDLQIFATCSSSSCSSHYSRWHCMVGAVGIRERNCRHPSGATTNVTILKTNARP